MGNYKPVFFTHTLCSLDLLNLLGKSDTNLGTSWARMLTTVTPKWQILIGLSSLSSLQFHIINFMYTLYQITFSPPGLELIVGYMDILREIKQGGLCTSPTSEQNRENQPMCTMEKHSYLLENLSSEHNANKAVQNIYRNTDWCHVPSEVQSILQHQSRKDRRSVRYSTLLETHLCVPCASDSSSHKCCSFQEWKKSW